MSEILGYLLFAFSVKLINCEQRQVLFSKVNNEDYNSSLAVFIGNVNTVLYCGVKCSIDIFCDGFVFYTNNSHCFGVHYFERGGYSYQVVPTTSDKTLWYRQGCGANWVEFKGHCYFHGQQTFSWPDAKMKCQTMNSHLAEIEDIEESDWISATLLNPDNDWLECIKDGNCSGSIFDACTAWIGLNDLGTEGQYVWDHSNTPMIFHNWYIFEPSLGDLRDCVDILRNGKWNDRPCSVLMPFICEKKINN